MAKRLQHRGGTTSQHSSFTGAVREVTVDTDKNTLVVHDGATAGGHPLATTTNFTSTGIDDNATSTAITIDSSQQVGIGTASPGAKLEIQTGSDWGNIINSTYAGTQYFQQFEYNGTSIGKIRGDNSSIKIESGSNLILQTANTERMRITSAGSVGIGTSSPSTALDISGGLTIDGNNNFIEHNITRQTASTNASRPVIRLTAKNTGSDVTDGFGSAIQFRMRDDTANVELGAIGFIRDGADGSGAFAVGQDSQLLSSSSQFIVKSSGNVGIGTGSPASKLEIYSTATFNARTSGINIHRPGSYGQYASIAFNSASTFFSSTYNGAGAGSYGDFKWQAYDTTSTPVERMRITNSGDLLVGKTSANTATEGVEFRSFGLGAFTRSGNQPIIANRTSNNGIILELQKDGTQVGVIGTLSSNLYVGSLDTGIYFNNSTDSIYAINTTTSAGRDNAIDLGVSATRFKDLYLGGGLYVGGTAAANKLDDYEEGTFTPTFRTLGGATSTITYSTQNGYYTKIGRMVYYQIQLNASSVSLGAGNTQLVLGGLPFSASPNWGFCSIGLEGNFPSTNAPQAARVEGSIIILQTSNSSDARDNLGSYLAATSLQNNSTIICGGCYLTNA
jgi:hypothetical protein